METLSKITRRAEKLNNGSSRWLVNKIVCVWELFLAKQVHAISFSHEQYSYLLGDETKHKYAVLMLRTTDVLELI